MSTRCQVEVKSSGLTWNEGAILLYHHTDGYPSYMLPTILKAYTLATAKGEYGSEAWRAGRTGKAASFLCAADPGVFEPEPNGKLHSDIEYFYEIEATNPKGGSVNDNPAWLVTVYVTGPAWNWDEPKRNALKKIAGPLPIQDAAKKAKAIEKKS